MAKMLDRCPVCEAGLNVSELACPRCQTRIHSNFETCRFCRLAPEHLGFVETFLRCEGNLSRVEKELGVSYPTVRNRLSAALGALGLGSEKSETPTTDDGFSFEFRTEKPARPSPPPPPVTPETSMRRREILDRLSRGEIGAEEAANALRDLS